MTLINVIKLNGDLFSSQMCMSEEALWDDWTSKRDDGVEEEATADEEGAGHWATETWLVKRRNEVKI